MVRFRPWLVVVLCAATAPSVNGEVLMAGEDGVGFPKLVERADPDLPPGLIAQGLEARVEYLAVVRSDGSLDDVRVRSCGTRKRGESAFTKLSAKACQSIEQSARKDVASRRYEPATKDGKPVDVGLLISVEFLFKEEPH